MNTQQLAFGLVIDEARFLEPFHEKANTRARGPYHFCQRLMTDSRNHTLGRSMRIEVGELQKNARKSFLAQTATLVNEILLVSNVPCQHVRPKHIRQLHLPRQCEHHGLFLNAQEATVCYCTGGCRAGRLTGDGILANKIFIAQYVEGCFLSGLGLNADLYLARLNDKQGIGRIALRVDGLPFPEKYNLPAIARG